MKKFIVLAALLGLSTVTFAQEDAPKKPEDVRTVVEDSEGVEDATRGVEGDVKKPEDVRTVVETEEDAAAAE